MPSYRNDRLASYYEGFPIIELTKNFQQDSLNWTIAREKCRARKKPIFQKMCILARAVQALSAFSKEAAESLTVDIISAERLKDKEYQNFGNLLAVLCSKTSSTENGNDIKPIEEVFDFISGWSTEAKDTAIFNTLLNIVIDYADDNKLKIRAAVLEYAAIHRKNVSLLASYSSLESVEEGNEEKEVTTPPLMLQTKRSSLAP